MEKLKFTKDELVLIEMLVDEHRDKLISNYENCTKDLKRIGALTLKHIKDCHNIITKIK